LLCHKADMQLTLCNIRYWPKADIPNHAIDVAIGGKADMAYCAAHVCFSPKADIRVLI